MIANMLQLVGLAIIFYYLFQGLPYSWERKAFATWGQLPLYFGTAIYGFEGIGVVLPLENQMKTPGDMKGWNGVLNTSMIIISCLYIAVGFFGNEQYHNISRPVRGKLIVYCFHIGRLGRCLL